MALVADAVDRYIADRREIREGEHPFWYPSNLGGCDRQAVLKRAGFVGSDFDLRTLRVFWMGDEVHTELQRAMAYGLPDDYFLVGHELRVRDEDHQVSGRLDTLIQRPDGEYEVIDYKSIRSTAFRKDLPKKEHVLQVGIYGTFPVSAFLPLPSWGRIAYWSKEDAKMEEYTFPITDELREEVKSRLIALTDQYMVYRESDVLPEPLPLVPIVEDGVPQFYVRGPKAGQPKTKLDWRVSYCPFLGTGKCCGDSYPSN